MPAARSLAVDPLRSQMWPTLFPPYFGKFPSPKTPDVTLLSFESCIVSPCPVICELVTLLVISRIDRPGTIPIRRSRLRIAIGLWSLAFRFTACPVGLWTTKSSWTLSFPFQSAGSTPQTTTWADLQATRDLAT